MFPSLTDTFGLAMIEALACGVPVAAFPVPGPLDVIEQGVTGVLHDDLAAAVRSALNLDRACLRAARRGVYLGRGDRAIPGRPRADPLGTRATLAAPPQFRYYRAYSRAHAAQRQNRRRQLMETADLSHHISRRFNEDLERVRSKVLGMGGFVEQQLHKAITALVEGDSSLGESVALDDYQVNNMEVSIDEECSRILATRAPAAGDLRVIVAIIKTITDLERIGDEGEKIGYIASRLATMERPADKYREIKHLGRVVSEMVHDALDAFARMDVESALRVARQDRLVDEEYEAIQRQSITFMMEDPRTIRRALDVMWVVRALERIGDHAKNISEYVIYMVHGKDIRHTSLEDVERELRAASAAGLEPIAGCRPRRSRRADRRTLNLAGFGSPASALLAYALYAQFGSASSPVRCASSSASAMACLGVCSCWPRCTTRGCGALVYAVLIGAGGAGDDRRGRAPRLRAAPAAGLAALLRRAAGRDAEVHPAVHDVIRKVLTGSGECSEVTWTLPRPGDARLGADLGARPWASLGLLRANLARDALSALASVRSARRRTCGAARRCPRRARSR